MNRDTPDTFHGEKQLLHQLYLWDDIKWGGLSEWARSNFDMDSRYVGYNEHNQPNENELFFDPHPSKEVYELFISEVLSKLI